MLGVTYINHRYKCKPQTKKIGNVLNANTENFSSYSSFQSVC